MRVPWYEARLPLKALVSTPEPSVRAAEPVVAAEFQSIREGAHSWTDPTDGTVYQLVTVRCARCGDSVPDVFADSAHRPMVCDPCADALDAYLS
jgi:hypothetical protein